MFDERMPVEVLHQWIKDGISQEKAASQSFLKNRDQNALRMPSYGEQLSEHEIADLSAYVALGQYAGNAGGIEELSKGEALARKYACFSCHGELGQGGIENPGSLKGYIPGFFGTDFRALTNNGEREDLIQWIRDGVSESFVNQGFAGFYPGRYFTERQAIKMPAYAELIPEREIDTLVDYLIELMDQGPLTAEGILEYRPIASSQSIPSEKTAAYSDPDSPANPISAIFEEHCIRCHGPEKQRSGYRLDFAEAAFKGGEIADFTGTAAIIPGNSEASLLVRFVEALEEDPFEEIYPMPPEDSPRLSSDQIEAIKDWIDRGAPWPDQ
jgi:mono/diheme cytochrome c family protein